MTRKWRPLLGALSAAFLAVTVACQEGQRPSRPATGPSRVLPEIRAEGWLNGPSISRGDLDGKVAVIDVWAWW